MNSGLGVLQFTDLAVMRPALGSSLRAFRADNPARAVTLEAIRAGIGKGTITIPAHAPETSTAALVALAGGFVLTKFRLGL